MFFEKVVGLRRWLAVFTTQLRNASLKDLLVLMSLGKLFQSLISEYLLTRFWVTSLFLRGEK